MPLLERVGGKCRFLGVLSGSILVTKTLELPRTRRAADPDRATVVIGPFETDQYAFLAHPLLEAGQKVTLKPRYTGDLARFPSGRPPEPWTTGSTQFEFSKELPYSVDDYEDPLWGDRWFGAFAPVGKTGYVVLVQTRKSAALRPTKVSWRLGHALLAASASFLLAWGAFFVWKVRGERRARETIEKKLQELRRRMRR